MSWLFSVVYNAISSESQETSLQNWTQGEIPLFPPHNFFGNSFNLILSCTPLKARRTKVWLIVEVGCILFIQFRQLRGCSLMISCTSHHPFSTSLHTLVHKSPLFCSQVCTVLSTSLHSLVHKSALSCPQVSTLMFISLHSLVHKSPLPCPYQSSA